MLSITYIDTVFSTFIFNPFATTTRHVAWSKFFSLDQHHPHSQTWLTPLLTDTWALWGSAWGLPVHAMLCGSWRKV